jgi:putative ABC transport system permease protein
MRRSLRSWLWRVPVGQEVDEELAFHVEMRRRELIEQGMDPAAAERTAEQRITELARTKRACVNIARKRDREMRLTQWLEELWGDVRFALRQLRAAPGFTAVAALTLALGIGANSAMFALVDATLLRPLPYPDSERLVAISESFRTFPRTTVAPLNFHDWHARNRTLAGMAAVFFYARPLIGAGGTIQQIPAQQVTAEFFEVFGIRPILGRTFRSTDIAWPPNVVVLSEGFWRSRFDADPAIVGQVIKLDQQPFTVIGVVPADFQVFSPSSMWTLWTELPTMDSRAAHFMRAVGRLKPGVTPEAAQSDLNTIAASLAREYPATNTGRGVTVDPLRDGLVAAEIKRTAMLFLGVVAFVLLMCCANVANLLLARTTGRARELAVRAALGAGRRRIVAQLLTESLVLAALGGLAGAGVGLAILRVAPSVIPPGLLPPAITLAFDGRVMIFCAGAAFSIGVLFGLVPAWQATSASPVRAMAAESRTTTGGGGRLRNLLVAGEVAVAVLLLCGAGLLLRTLILLGNVDSGAGVEDALTMRVSLDYGPGNAQFTSEEGMRQFFDRTEREIQALPGVRHAAWGSALPLEGFFAGGVGFDIVGDPPSPPGERPFVDYQIVSPSFLTAIDVPIVAGRGLSDFDSTNGPAVCLVSEAFARLYAPGRDPLGMRIVINPIGIGRQQPVTREIVGVVKQVKQRPGDLEDGAIVYVPRSQNTWNSAVLVVTPAGGAAADLAPAVRTAIARVNRSVPVGRFQTLDEVTRGVTERPRFRTVMVMTFAALALILAMVGVFGVLAYSVQQRRREFGVRMALGATSSNVLRMVLAGAGRLIGTGAFVGLLLAAFLAQSISTFLFGVRPVDPLTFAAVAGVLIVTAGIAAAVPALRASRTDPVVAFRND